MVSTQSTFNIVSIIICIIVISIMVFSFYVTFKYRSPEQYKQTRINVFFSALASVAIIFVAFNIVLTTISFEYNQHFARLTKTKEAVDRLWLYPNKVLKTSRNIRPEFLASFYLSNLDLYNLVILPNKKTNLTQEGIIEEQFIAHVMIQSWEDCLIIRRYDATPLTYWLRSFMTWAQNPYFKKYYERIKFSYTENTLILGDLLFEYAAKIPVPTKDINDYSNTVEELMRDPRYINLIHNMP